MQLLPMASSPDGLISAPECGHHKDPRPGGAHHNPQRECHTRPWVLDHQCVTCWGEGGGGCQYTGYIVEALPMSSEDTLGRLWRRIGGRWMPPGNASGCAFSGGPGRRAPCGARRTRRSPGGRDTTRAPRHKSTFSVEFWYAPNSFRRICEMFSRRSRTLFS